MPGCIVVVVAGIAAEGTGYSWLWVAGSIGHLAAVAAEVIACGGDIGFQGVLYECHSLGVVEVYSEGHRLAWLFRVGRYEP